MTGPDPQANNHPKGPDGAGRQSRRSRRKRLTPDRLRNWALGYLGRFAATEAHLVVVLERKIKRHMDPDTNEEEQAQWFAKARDVAADMVRLGIVDDRLYAEARARSLHRKGKSRRVIARNLTAKGVAPDVAEAALAALGAEEGVGGEALDLAGAMALARRRRIGPWRKADTLLDDRQRRRELGVFARAGFGFALARLVMEARDEASLAAILAEKREEDAPKFGREFDPEFDPEFDIEPGITGKKGEGEVDGW